MRIFGWIARALLCAALIAPAAAAPKADSGLPPDEWKAIQRVVEDQLTALKAGDGAKAMTYAVPGIQLQFGSAENFLRMVRTGYAPLLSAQYTVFIGGAIIDGVPVQPLRLVMPDNTVLVALYQMQRMGDGRWRIAGVRIAPSNAAVQAT